MVLPEGARATSLNRLFFNAPGAPPHLLLLPPENRKPALTSRQESSGKEDSRKLETFQMEPCG